MYLSVWKRFLNTTQIKRNYLEKPAGLEWRSNELFIVVTVGIGLFTDLFLYGLFVPVLPFMLVDRIGLSPDQVQANVSSLLAAYAGASVVISPIAGIITDRLATRREPFLLGVTSLFGATLLLLNGRTIPMLLTARMLQGISAAFVWTTGMALCLETVGAEKLGKTIGATFGFISIGNLLAPMLGGMLYNKGGLAGVFGLSFTVLVVDFIMRVLVIEVKVAHRYKPIDSSVSDPLIPTVDQLQAEATDEEQEEGSNEFPSLLRDREYGEESYQLSSNLLKIMRIVPILPCLADPRLVTALLISFVQAMLLGSIDATVPVVSQEYYNFSSLQAGLMFLPIGIANLIFGPLLGWCVDRFGTKKVAVLVYLYLVPILFSFRLVKPGGVYQIAVYETLLALAGIGIAGMGAPSVVEASTVVQKYHQANLDFFGDYGPYAQLYSLSYLFFSLGLTIGSELAGGLRQKIGYGNMNAVLAAICALTALTCFLFIGGKSKIVGQRSIA